MFYLERKDKITIGFCLIALLCLICYGIGYYHGTKDSVPQLTKTQQEDTAPPPPDTRLGISADLFTPNFNAFSDYPHIKEYQHAQGDFIEFGNNSHAVIIIGQGDINNLDSIGVIFPKHDSKAYNDGVMSIAATISAVSPSTTDAGRYYIIDQLGLHDNINEASGMKLSEYNGKRYFVSYEGNKVMFSAMTIPPQ